MPEFFIIDKKGRIVDLVELKPNRLARNQRASYERMYLSSTQESKIKRLLSWGMPVGIMYYNKIGRKMVYSNVIWLSSKNLKSFCYSTPWEKRFDPDTLKFDQEKLIFRHLAAIRCIFKIKKLIILEIRLKTGS